MTETIWPFELKDCDFQKVELPKGAEIIHAAYLAKKIMICARIDAFENEKEKRTFGVRPMMHPLPPKEINIIGVVVKNKKDIFGRVVFEYLKK